MPENTQEPVTITSTADAEPLNGAGEPSPESAPPGGGAVVPLSSAHATRHATPALGRTTFSPINVDRPVFTLSVAADLLGMHPRTLRIYEEEGLVVPARTETKRRRYSQNDIKRFQFIQHLTQRLRVNLAGVRIILEMMSALEACGVDFMPRLNEMAEQATPTEEDLAARDR